MVTDLAEARHPQSHHQLCHQKTTLGACMNNETKKKATDLAEAQLPQSFHQLCNQKTLSRALIYIE